MFTPTPLTLYQAVSSAATSINMFASSDTARSAAPAAVITAAHARDAVPIKGGVQPAA